MTREECEAKIVEMMREIYETYKQYNPVGNYLALFFKNGHMMGNNSYYDLKSIDHEKQIDFFEKLSDGAGNEKA